MFQHYTKGIITSFMVKTKSLHNHSCLSSICNSSPLSLTIISLSDPTNPVMFLQVPALQRYTRTRAQLHQQPGVSIYTSTLIARVNVRNANTTNTEPETGTEPVSGPDQVPPNPNPNTNRIQEQTARNTSSNSNSNSEILQFPDLNPPREAGAAGFNLPNPLSSILLWILGGASSEGIISFFSMFRDPRDQPPGYTEPPPTPPQPPAQQEENTVT